MLQLNKTDALRPRDIVDSIPLSSPSEIFGKVGRFVSRNLGMAIVTMMFAGGAAVLYLQQTAPTYTASVDLVIDTRKIKPYEQQSISGENTIDAGTVQTQVEVLKSRDLSLSVIRSLKLAQDPEFVSPPSGLSAAISSVIARFSAPRAATKASPELRALAAFDKMRSIGRVGQTYVMEIGFQSRDPEKAARIANAIADAYVRDQLDAKYQATLRASSWLKERMQELRAQSVEAEKAVSDFKQKSNISTVDSNGKLMNEQQVSELNTQLVTAHAATAEARARLDRINEVLKQPIPDASVADAMHSQVIIKLRQQYLDLAGREAIWEGKYGVDHPATINLRNQMEELRHNVSDEMQKMAEIYKSDLDIAEARERAIRISLDVSVTESHVATQARSELRELESTSQSYRTMYDNILQRYTDSVQQQSFPNTEARVISPAASPEYPSNPKTMIVGAAAMAGGLLLSLAIATFRELTDRGFRTRSQLEKTLEITCLSAVPMTKSRRRPLIGYKKPSSSERLIDGTRSRDLHVLSQPMSYFCEELRSLKVALDAIKDDSKIVGFTSAVPSEGKSTLSANFAALVAHTGARVLLLDADLRNPTLSERLAGSPKTGLLDVISGHVQLSDAIYTEPKSKLEFLPTGNTEHLHHTNEVLASQPMEQLLSLLKKKYDFILVDLPPLLPIVDARAAVKVVDNFVLVVEWGGTSIEVVKQALDMAPAVYERLVGAVLNKVSPKQLVKFESYNASRYHKRYFKGR